MRRQIQLICRTKNIIYSLDSDWPREQKNVFTIQPKVSHLIRPFLKLQDVEEEVAMIQKAMGTTVDITFDCVGSGKTMRTALNATRPGGKVCLVGMGHSEMSVPLTAASAR